MANESKNGLTKPVNRINNEQYNRSVEKSDSDFTRWCEDAGIPLHSIQHVITWCEWDDGIGVFFFLNTNSDLKRFRGKYEEMKEKYLHFLEKYQYPFSKFPNVAFELDSDENVRKNYGGSYFNRLR